MRKFVTGSIILTMLASPSFAAKQYWIIQQSTSCTVVDEKPNSATSDVGKKAYASRAEAERALRTTKGCAPE
jgi:hypothetical protein